MSKRRVISQREAWRTARELRKLQEKYDQITSRYRSDFPGPSFWRMPAQEQSTRDQIATVRQLGFGVAARIDQEGALRLYAVKS